jgi:hypothetical protein
MLLVAGISDFSLCLPTQAVRGVGEAPRAAFLLSGDILRRAMIS